MIGLIETVLRKQSGETQATDFPLGYLKFSTVTSGATLNDKVIFLVFPHNSSSPRWCIKTVRHYGAKDVIVRNFNNLRLLNKLTEGTPEANLFARALYLHDDGQNIFSIETAFLGRKTSLSAQDLDSVVEVYTKFQEHLSKGYQGGFVPLATFLREVLEKAGVPSADVQVLLRRFNDLPAAAVELPRLIQHGDLTADNILFAGTKPCIVDYDFVGLFDVPGLDLFGLFRRTEKDVTVLCKKYFPGYFEHIGASVSSGDYLQLFFLYYLIEEVGRKGQGRATTSSLIAEFEKKFT